MDGPVMKSLIGRPGEFRHPVSRGWEPVECARVSCAYNDQRGWCAAQRNFPHDGEGRCLGFIVHATPSKTASD